MKNESSSGFKDSELYKKAIDILNLSDHLTIICDQFEGKYAEIVNHYGQEICTNSAFIPTKIADTWNVEYYAIKMENAALIRKAARDIISITSGLKMILAPHDKDYFELLTTTLEGFRVLFAEWVKTFDPWNYSIDRWGLYNPPGVNYDDPDPDDDIPFNPSNLLE